MVEFASLAPAPFACMMLADLGADVLRIDRPGGTGPGSVFGGEAPAEPEPPNPLTRGRRDLVADLKDPAARQTVGELLATADVLVEGFRPGVMERLGFGPQPCLARNPGLVYGRMTGWGQTGPLAGRAGHDINYLALSGALEPLGPADGPPLPPLNYVADFGGGGMLLAVGILAALHERARSGLGQVVDASMTEGAALMTGLLHGLAARGLWDRERGRNLFDGCAPFYSTYTCADGRFVAVGAVEPHFYAQLLHGLDPDLAGRIDPAQQFDQATWPTTKALLALAFAARPRDEWAEHFARTDACVSPVLSPWEAHEHPHNRSRGTFIEVDGQIQPGPAPRFSR